MTSHRGGRRPLRRADKRRLVVWAVVLLAVVVVAAALSPWLGVIIVGTLVLWALHLYAEETPEGQRNGFHRWIIYEMEDPD